jgi:hypothetical protein
VQIWNGKAISWLSVPIINSSENINQTAIDNSKNWRRKHLNLLEQSYSKAPFKADMLDIVERVYAESHVTICSLSVSSISHVCRYFNISNPDQFRYSSELGISGQSSKRVLDIVSNLKGTQYITGHGALHYLEHSLFEKNAKEVKYMDYQKIPYPQLCKEFTPFISTLDLIANCGKSGLSVISSGTKDWKEFVK